MSDLIEKLWPAFEAEVSEQLEQLEQMLARGPGAADIHFLFRQFHTIKSSSAMMEFAGMEAIAHAAEDLLDRVRRGEQAMAAGFISVLMRAVDVLRRQMAEGLRDRRPPAGDPALVAELRQLSAAPAVGAAAGAATASVQHAAEENSTGDAAPDDLQDAVDAFMQSARLHLPLVALATAQSQPQPESAALLAEQAEAAGLRVVARLLKRLATADASLALLEELLARLRHIETLAGQAAGCEAAFAELRPLLEADFRRRVAAAAAVAAETLESAADAERGLQTVLPLRHFCRLLGLQASETLLNLIQQVLREIARDALFPGPSLGAQLALALGIMADLPPDLAEDLPYVAMTEQLLDNIQREIAYADDIEMPGEAAVPVAVPELDISSDMQAVLSHSARAQLAAHVAAGHLLVEIDADMESMADGGEAFVAWLAAQGTQLANHTVFHGEGSSESTQLRFLAAFGQSLPAVVAGLGELDPEGCLLHLRPLNAAQAVPVALPAVEAAEPAAATRGTASTVRIDSRALDGFVNRVGELVMLRNMMSHSFADERVGEGFRRLRRVISGDYRPDAAEREQLQGLIDELAQRREKLLQADARLQEALSHLQDDVLALRVVPVGTVFNRMTRVVWGLAQAQDKQVHVDIRGEETRIDKGMVDILAEPLSHMVRNAIDHGIEMAAERAQRGKPATATLTLSASRQGNALLVTVADDGRGLDLSRILAKARALGLADARHYNDSDITNFIFAPGFSTAEQVSAVSGRGVGMDVVKTRIAQIGGQIDVQSRPGQGVTFTLRLPLSVAIQSVVLVASGNNLLALPERQVDEVLRLPRESLQTVQGQAACLLRGVVLPLYGLERLLGSPATATTATELDVVVFSDGRHRIGLVVPHVLGRQEVFVRDIHPDILRLPGVGGACILGDGRVVLITDGDKLMDLARRQAQGLQEMLTVAGN